MISDPGYWLHGSTGVPGFTQGAWRTIVGSITLPAANPLRPLRYSDSGTIAALSQQSGGYRITLDRDHPDGGHRTVGYLIPDTIAKTVTLSWGSQVTVYTDGRTVIGLR